MADFNPPSAGEIAWGEARQAADKIEKLEQRIATLERQVEAILRDRHYEGDLP